MTEEQAIELLKIMRSDDRKTLRYITALDMAIDALQKVSSNQVKSYNKDGKDIDFT